MHAPIPGGPRNRLNPAIFMLEFGASVVLFSRIVTHVLHVLAPSRFMQRADPTQV